MSRYYHNKKDVVDDCRWISANKLTEWDYFCGFRAGRIIWTSSSGKENSIDITVDVGCDVPYAKLFYIVTDKDSGEKTTYDYRVQLTSTNCHYGGKRYWFLCPLSKNGQYCGKRVGKLYLDFGSSYFGCRHCLNLSYDSRNQRRGGFFGTYGRMLDLDVKLKKLEDKVKIRFRKGEPTKKYRQILKIYDQFRRLSPVLDRETKEIKDKIKH